MIKPAIVFVPTSLASLPILWVCKVLKPLSHPKQLSKHEAAPCAEYGDHGDLKARSMEAHSRISVPEVWTKAVAGTCPGRRPWMLHAAWPVATAFEKQWPEACGQLSFSSQMCLPQAPGPGSGQSTSDKPGVAELMKHLSGSDARAMPFTARGQHNAMMFYFIYLAVAFIPRRKFPSLFICLFAHLKS